MSTLRSVWSRPSASNWSSTSRIAPDAWPSSIPTSRRCGSPAICAAVIFLQSSSRNCAASSRRSSPPPAPASGSGSGLAWPAAKSAFPGSAPQENPFLPSRIETSRGEGTADGQTFCLAPADRRRHRVDDPASDALQQLRLRCARPGFPQRVRGFPGRGDQMELIGGLLVLLAVALVSLNVCAGGLCRGKDTTRR